MMIKKTVRFLLTFIYMFIQGERILKADDDFLKNSNTFPKIFSSNIENKNYDDEDYQKQLSKNNMVLLGFYKGWESNRKISSVDVVKKIKSLNPKTLVGQYTILNEFTIDTSDEAKKDIIAKLDSENWWLYDSKKNKLQWTEKYNAYEVNITKFVKPDQNMRRFPEWLAKRNYEIFFKDRIFDFWFIDNFFDKPRVGSADWMSKRVNISSKDERILKAYREGYISHLNEAKKLAPEMIFIGNVDSELSAKEYRYQLNGALLEGLMGYSWSLETWAGWHSMMERYHNVFENLIFPKIVVFCVIGDPNNKQFFRYAYTSSLMNDGYFSFTDINNEYGSVVWFEEFDFNLGKPFDKAQKKPWKENVYRREFEKGIVYVNPGTNDFELNVDWIKDYQSNEKNKKESFNSRNHKIIIKAKDGIIIKKENEK